MREIGLISNEADASRFADYLLTLGVTTKLDRRDTGWAVWVREEEQVARAGEELQQFVQDPRAARYVEASCAARELRLKSSHAARDAKRNFVSVRDRWDRQQTARGRPITTLLILLSVAVALFTKFGEDQEGLLPYLWSADVRWEGYGFGSSQLHDLRHGQVWRLLTPIFIHYGPLHLIFNMWWLYDLGGIIEIRRGRWRYAGLILALALVSNETQQWATGPGFGGMSGVVFGLFGYIWMRGRYDPQFAMLLSPGTVFMMIAWFFLCMTGKVGAIANWAHGGGLVAGMILGIAGPLWKNLTRR